MSLSKAIFLDRDGVLNVDSGYTYRPSDLIVPENVPESLKVLQDKGFKLVVITNQSGVARGFFSLDEVHAFHRSMQREMLARAGVRLDHFYICPHYPGAKVAVYDQTCRCRKPEPGLILQAAQELRLDLSHSWMIGDRDSDIQCGQRAKVKTIWQVNPKYPLPETVKPDHSVANFAEILAIIEPTR